MLNQLELRPRGWSDFEVQPQLGMKMGLAPEP